MSYFMSETLTKYFVVNKATGEKIEVLPHTSGQGTFSFNEKSLADNDPEQDGSDFANDTTLYTFTNGIEDADADGYIDNPGDFVNNDVEQLDVTGEWDIVREEVAA